MTTGAVVARHAGAQAFTIGQRRGLNLRTPAEDGSPRYVVGLDLLTNTVQVGPADLLDIDLIEGERPIWSGAPFGTEPVRVDAQVRAHGTAIEATARLVGDRLIVELEAPVRGLAPGQTIALYRGTRVVASATVDVTGTRP